uniref:t-SNARE coiled-coil homology domain-containing protein n=2 Tax=Hemiselmis andersenii TaxID=464988 RepID=A0A7S0UBE9_HEMAN
MESLAAKAQGHLLMKDKRIFQSLNLAARKKALDAEGEDVEFKQARNTQIALDQRLVQLTGKLHAQEQALAYMAPRLQERVETTDELHSMVQQLDQVVPKIKPDLKTIGEQLQEIKDAGKQTREQMMTASEELGKYKNAYKLFGERMQEAREKAAIARREVEADNVQALRATEASTGLRQRAATAQGAQQGQMLVADSEREAARAEMLNRQSAEAAQSNQLFDAEADESLAYMSMFGADAQQADQRLKGESMKLQALGRQYARGRFLAQNGAARDQYLKAELAKAKKALDRSELVSEDDKLAFMTGEKATQATAKEVGVEERAAVGNTEKAAGEARKLDEDKAQWEEDSAQADSIKRAAEEHARAEEHLEAASTLNPK